MRVPVLRCRQAINVGSPGEVTVEAARAALEAAPGVEVMDDTANKVYPMPGLLAGTDGTFVGRLRKDPTVPHGIAFWDVADQIRRARPERRANRPAAPAVERKTPAVLFRR